MVFGGLVWDSGWCLLFVIGVVLAVVVYCGLVKFIILRIGAMAAQWTR